MTNDLITTIGRQLNIAKSTENEQLCQIVYSIAGQMALASLWDRTEDNTSISIQHFKKRIAQIFDAYQSLFPKLEFLFPKVMEDRKLEWEVLFSNKQIDWTLIRLPFVKDSLKSNDIKESLTDMPGTKITNQDIATFILDQINNQKYIHKAPFISH